MRYFYDYEKKAVCVLMAVILCFLGTTPAFGEEKPTLTLNALSACLLDGESGRVLYGKNETERRAMASTTKIMTLIVTLENADLSDVVTISQNAARQPDVQLNVNTGEQYVLEDLLYSLMLESHNDVAVAIAEHVGGSVEGFAAMMNEKAAELGMENTYYITPNGLDAEDENGKHSTTAVDLARLAAYAVKNDRFVEITNTKSHSFREVNGKRSFTVNNKNLFLSMMSGAIGVKTGFTGEAGYCFVGAVRQEGRTFISVVLGSGWPPNKTYKWKDTRTLMQFGLEHYFPETVYDEEFYETVPVSGSPKETVDIRAKGNLSMLLSEYDTVRVYYEYKEKLTAPVYANELVGNIYVTLNGEIVDIIEIRTVEDAPQDTFIRYIEDVLKIFLFS
ncbi:MAG: D-alanyl-D-alanine carboxypeptidase [Alistipes sp.]|nr:D-alanyl-D-alanine carboxypeptidase [Alistipes sp.]